MSDVVPIEEWAGELSFLPSLTPTKSEGGVAKASMKVRQGKRGRPETRWANHEQGEGDRNISGGPNPLSLQWYGTTCG